MVLMLFSKLGTLIRDQKYKTGNCFMKFFKKEKNAIVCLTHELYSFFTKE
jgi:hypothetical protein